MTKTNIQSTLLLSLAAVADPLDSQAGEGQHKTPTERQKTKSMLFLNTGESKTTESKVSYSWRNPLFVR